MDISRIKFDREILDKFEKRQLQMVNDYSTIEEKIDRYNYQFVRNNLENYRKGTLEARYIKTSLQTFLYLTSGDIKVMSIIERFFYDDIQKMISGICTSARLQYLYFATKEFEVDGADCLHIYPLLDALSVRDFELSERFMEALPGPARHGQRLSRLLCNSVFSVLRMDSKEMKASADKIRKFSEGGTFDGAMLDALLAIIENSTERLEDAVRTMLKNNAMKYKPNEALQNVCIPAHAMVNLAEHIHGEVITSFLPKLDSICWDVEFHKAVKSRKSERINEFCDFRELNPVLQNWMDILPVQFRLEECVQL